MQTRNLTQRHSRIRRAFAFAGGALLWLFSASAQAQTPSPPSPSTFPGSASSYDTLPRSQPTDAGNDAPPVRPERKLRRDKVDFNKLFPTEKSAPDAQSSSGIRVAPPSKAEEDSPADLNTLVALCHWPSADCALYLADPPNSPMNGPDGLPPGFPDSTILLPGPDDIDRKWATDGPDTTEAPRDEIGPTYRINEEAPPTGPVDLEPALEAVYRTFLEEQPSLLAFHLRREEFMGLNTPGQTPGWVRSDLLLDRLAALFSDRHTIALEYLRPYPMESSRFGVKAWYTYRDKAGNIYRAHLRFVLKPLDDRLILTSFALD